MSGVFVCYRRKAGIEHAAGRLRDDLASRFGDDSVFMDVDSVGPGEDWMEAIESALAASAVLIAVIHPGWVDDERLLDEDDLLRIEIVTALTATDVLVVPVLINGASPLKKGDLPEALRPLARRQALPLRHASWHSDVEPLVAAIRRRLGDASARPADVQAPPRTAAAVTEQEPAEPIASPGSTPIADYLGIDLGTTSSVMATLVGGVPTVIENNEGRRTTPSVVAFDESGRVLVGDEAKRMAVSAPRRTIGSVQRHIGTGWKIAIDGKRYTAQEISARILLKLKRDAEARLGKPVTGAVVTVPAHFNDAQRQATKEAAQIAGLEVLRIINAPTAAALAYGLNQRDDRMVVVYSLGGGMFDASVLETGEGVFEVRSAGGDTTLGGDDWDQRIVDRIVTEFENEHGIDLSEDPIALSRLREAAEQAKTELSSALETEISLPFIAPTPGGPLHLQQKLTRSEFERMTADLVERTREIVMQAVDDAEISVEEIDHVILAGGATRMPAVRTMVEELAGKSPVAGLDPESASALGAVIEAAVLVGDLTGLLVLDIAPLSIGVETEGGVFTKMIERNTTIPTRRTEVFTTAEDNQAEVEIHVLQGERPMADENLSLGRFKLTGIPPAPHGEPQIEVTFDIDADGQVMVSAKDLGTGESRQVTIAGGTALDEAEIDRMARETQASASQHGGQEQ